MIFSKLEKIIAAVRDQPDSDGSAHSPDVLLQEVQ